MTAIPNRVSKVLIIFTNLTWVHMYWFGRWVPLSTHVLTEVFVYPTQIRSEFQTLCTRGYITWFYFWGKQSNSLECEIDDDEVFNDEECMILTSNTRVPMATINSPFLNELHFQLSGTSLLFGVVSNEPHNQNIIIMELSLIQLQFMDPINLNGCTKSKTKCCRSLDLDKTW